MQTSFSLAQLADPDTAQSEKILRACVHCGFCTATCPTYLLTGDELDGPRGRIYLIKDMLEGGRAASATVAKHIDRCLSCLACMTACPSGVHYMHLVDHARRHIAETFKRPAADRWLRKLLAAILPRPDLFRFSLHLARLARPVSRLLPGRLAGLARMAPTRISGASAVDRPQVFPAEGERKRRVALLSGCVQTVLRPGINEATIRLLNRHGIEVVVAAGAGCCGALTHHLGDVALALTSARRNIEAWAREIEGQGLDAIVVNASGCGTMVKDYGFLFRQDPQWAEKAARIASLTRDITEILDEIGLKASPGVGRRRVAYHSACSMQHGQALNEPPRRLIAAAGFELCEIAEGHLCCGSAGSYSILQPGFAGQLKARKIANIARTKAELVVAGNIGCMEQLADGLDMPMIHTAELLDWATGGPEPAGLRQIPDWGANS